MKPAQDGQRPEEGVATSAAWRPANGWRLTLPGPVLGLAAILLLFVVVLSLNGQIGNFLSLSNLQLILHECSVPAVVALGMLLVIISGGIDLSVGSVTALVTVAAVEAYRLLLVRTGSVPLASLAAVGAGVGVGGLCGLLNGLAITGLRVSPFVATLGMLSVARGAAYWLSGRTVVALPGSRPGWVRALQSAEGAALFDPGVWLTLALAGLAALLLRATVFGRHVYAVGSNEATARLCGVAVGRTKVWVYVLAGLCTGLAGILRFAQGSSGDPGAAVGLELDVIAAVVIGGAALSGGQGGVGGTLLGVLILNVLENGVNRCGVPVEVKFILIGLIVVFNTALSQWQRRRE
jgi:ribose transport system permease protein